ncbi:hypothetical protein [Marinivivus vitaminiproducens]|uniref:hypothetical protein n=1 Tax=Marinivivus vitaminiproducens TaxID=3035935 RepID=UPI00279B723E|nr:hypothetical protein P4R82_23080 [Geminicoccaceae bacterium SCSIO 64248]
MSVGFDTGPRRSGTCFLLYPQSPELAAFATPERVWLSPEPQTIGPGPSDSRMYVVNPLEKLRIYEYPYLPPFDGPALTPAQPGPEGHFDHLVPGTPAFAAAHLYGSIRRTLDVWEGYFGCPIPWHFRRDYERLEMIPWVDWDNAHSGYGYIETGWRGVANGSRVPLSLCFDVLAHEIGHSILFTCMGTPPPARRTQAFLAFHETAADLIALIATLHFDSVLDHVLAQTHGNLFAPNEINRIGELSDTEQIRVVSTDLVMEDVADIVMMPDGTWQDGSGGGRKAHGYGLPLTGAFFDLLVDVYQAGLLEAGLVPPDIDQGVRFIEHDPSGYDDVDRAFADLYRGRHALFRRSLIEARDYMGRLLARVFTDIEPDGLRFSDVAQAVLRADRALTGGRYRRHIIEDFAWRHIPVPRMPGMAA